MQRRCGWTVLLGLTLVVTVAGCAPSGQVLSSDEFVTVVQKNPSGGMDAIITGTLAVTESGCLGLQAEQGAPVYPVIWPPGAVLGHDSSITIGADSYRVGDTVTGGGGEVQRLEFDVPTECESEFYEVLSSVHPR